MKAPLAVHNKRKYFQFHHDHGYDTEKYIQLKDEVEALILWGYLGKYIHGGRDWPNA